MIHVLHQVCCWFNQKQCSLEHSKNFPIVSKAAKLLVTGLLKVGVFLSKLQVVSKVLHSFFSRIRHSCDSLPNCVNYLFLLRVKAKPGFKLFLCSISSKKRDKNMINGCISLNYVVLVLKIMMELTYNVRFDNKLSFFIDLRLTQIVSKKKINLTRYCNAMYSTLCTHWN